MTLASPIRMLARRWWLGLGAATLAGAIAGALFTSRLSENALHMAGVFEREPFEHAVTFAYAWGSAADASELLGRYAERLRATPDWEPSALPSELAFTKFRKAIVEQRSRAQMVELCRTTPKCKPEKLDSLIAKLAAQRNVGGPP